MEELAGDRRLSLSEKMIYAVSTFRQPTCIERLARDAGMNSKYLVRHCRNLERLGWMRLIEDGKRLRPDVLVPRDIESRIASSIRRTVDVVALKGESTTWFFEEWIVAPSVRLIRHARPKFLRNENTGESLEYDIFGPDHAWATEYHGDQHFGPTSRYPSEKAFIERHKRDLRKIQISKKNRIRLTVVHNQILNLNGILELIPDDVPRRVIDPNGPVVQVLERLGREVAQNQDWDRE